MSPNDPPEEPKKKRADSEKEVKRNRFLSMLGFFRRGKQKKEAAKAETKKKPEPAAPLAPNAALNTPSQLSASGSQERPESERPKPRSRVEEIKAEAEPPKTLAPATRNVAETVQPESTLADKETETETLEPSLPSDAYPSHEASFTKTMADVPSQLSESQEEENAQTETPAPESTTSDPELVEAVVATVHAAAEADLAESKVSITEETQEDAVEETTKTPAEEEPLAPALETEPAKTTLEAESPESKPETVVEASEEKASEAEKEPEHAPDIMANLEDLPRSYKSNRARLIMVDPERLFLHWNFSLAASRNQAVVMRFRRHFLGQPRVQETVPLGSQTVGTYYFVTEPGSFYDAVFGTVVNGAFEELYQSNLVKTPPVRPRYSEVAVWKVRETVPAVTTPDQEEEDAAVSVWREPEVEERAELVAAVAETAELNTFENHVSVPHFSPSPQASAMSLPEQALAPVSEVQAPTVSWVDSDYQPPHMALSNTESNPSFYSDPNIYNALDSGDLPEDPRPRENAGFTESLSATMGNELQLPSVRWIGASEFILVSGPGSLIPALPGSQGASWNVHVSASEPARRIV